MSRTRHFVQKLPIKTLLAAPLLLYLGVTLFWQSRGIYNITGDEPHYLIIADSIVHDRDVLVSNNYAADTPVKRSARINFDDPFLAGPHVHNQYSLHNVGLAALIAPAYALSGVTGSQIFMALLTALWPLLIYRTLLGVTESREWSALLAFTLGAGLPFTAAASRLYPDLTAGLMILYLAWKALPALKGEQWNGREPAASAAIIGLLLALLPWLHVRLAAPALLLFAAHVYARVRAGGARTPWLIIVAAFACSLALLAVYNQAAFGTPLGPYGKHSRSLDLDRIAMIFLGLHFDQSQGMFVQQPLLALGLLGAGLLAGDNRRGAVLLALVYLSMLVPSSMHPAWYGGGSFFGRFWWTAAPLWIIPMAHAVKFMLRRRETVLLLACAAALLYQLWLASGWLVHDNLLIYGEAPLWASRSLFENTGLLLRLPTFRDFGLYMLHPANYVFVLFGLLLLATGWLWRRGAFGVIREVWAWSAVAGVCVLVFATPAVGSWRMAASDLRGQVGTVEGTSRVAQEKDGAGALVFGPYTMLAPGNYKVRLEYQYNGDTSGPAPHFDVVYSPGPNTVADAPLPPSADSGGVFEHKFTVREDQSLRSLFEFRVFYTGRGTLSVKGITVTPLALHSEY